MQETEYLLERALIRVQGVRDRRHAKRRDI